MRAMTCMYIDTIYVWWLRLNHPEVNTCMQDAPVESGSILDHFPYIAPASLLLF